MNPLAAITFSDFVLQRKEKEYAINPNEKSKK
jgi:hypothetical protein